MGMIIVGGKLALVWAVSRGMRFGCRVFNLLHVLPRGAWQRAAAEAFPQEPSFVPTIRYADLQYSVLYQEIKLYITDKTAAVVWPPTYS